MRPAHPFIDPMVRGEHVYIIRVLNEGNRPRPGALGASTPGANVLVEYPGGEQGYVPMSEITEGITAA